MVVKTGKKEIKKMRENRDKEILNKQLIASVINNDRSVMIASLDDGADACAVDEDGNTGLHHALSLDRKDCAVILLQKGTDEHIRNKSDKTAIDMADPKIADWFIQKSRHMRLQQLLSLEKKVLSLTKRLKIIESQAASKTHRRQTTTLFSDPTGSGILAKL